MKRWLSTVFTLLFTAMLFAQQPFVLYSPDSSLRLEVKVDQKIAWSLFAGKELLVSSPSIDIELADGRKLSDARSITNSRISSRKQTIQVPLPYRRKNISNQHNHLDLSFKDFLLQFWLFDNGMAYKTGTVFLDSIKIKNETALFDIDPRSALWFAHIDKRPAQDRFHTSFEGVYKKEVLETIPDTMLTYAPVTAVLPNGYKLAFSDADLYNYPGMFLQKTATGLKGVFAPYPLKEEMTEGEFPQLIVTERADYIAVSDGICKTPWRVILVAKKDTDLPENDLLYCLGYPQPKGYDFSWVKPAKGTDEWITGINLFDVPFEAGINTTTYKYYIDFAKRFGFDQVMLDAGWSDVKDLFKINPAVNMEELARYAKTKGVKLMLWTLCSTLDKQLDSVLKQFSKWGVHSIMTDFMDRDDQKTVNFYHRIAKACADNKIAVMFHGAYPPKGLNRTWPNVITQEGVLGAEWNIWSDLPTPEHNVAIAYTRMLAGPLDYEPGLLLNAQKDQFRPIGKNPMSIGTRCHQLAMFVVYDSPLQIFSGNISQGIKEPAFMQLLGSLPTTWDETKVLQGKIGEYIITARQKGNNWYIAGLNNSTTREITIPLDFLKSGSYTITVCKDGVNAHNYGSDYSLTTSVINAGSKLTLKMAPGGGFLVRLIKK
ncbi:MAG: glycoside hydrolase family 97 protein [Chitinophagaceae bacterium]|nr:glycoside hydrolase family 97 protein [Chitinophagaceae bacterium]